MASVAPQRPLVGWEVSSLRCASAGIGLRSLGCICQAELYANDAVFVFHPFRKRDIAANIRQRGEENHQVRAGRLHIVPPTL